MKSFSLLILLIIAFACRPHYDFSKERADVKSEAKSDSLVYQSDFQVSHKGWDAGAVLPVTEAGNYIIAVDTVNRSVQSLSPVGSILFDYAVSTKVKIGVQDSTAEAYAGLLFDRIDTTYYRMLCISNKGTFYLKDVCNGEESFLIPKISSRYLSKGRNAWNTIGIRHRKKEVHILFNGSIAAICRINKAFSYGALGLVAATTENRIRFSPVKAVFESFTVKKIREERD